ncbi:unnamed protein product [Nippostrongylus brasiliensis]|uniref:MADF domain-containing protein n=1 Tax=Nippostrongylus brasiliensis TaxID=27835 RepID=A0A0N4XTU1_NIPBR|nr:hypothetical protein Q1695_009689 [Nippostrongylus brasiliensis]VDL69641.1 unnamed protein product [Nippostrongylus brasiliensis]
MDYLAKCRLIRLVEEEEPIWNTGIDDYARLDKKNASWNRIHKEMIESGFNGGMLELKTTWKNLRDQWRKISLGKQTGNLKSWAFEKHLLFLATAQTEVDKKESAVRRWLASVFGDEPAVHAARSHYPSNSKSGVRMDVAMKRQFIRMIREEELLWNTECRDYYRLDKKNLAWSRILTRLERDGFHGGLLELKAAWKVLRDTKRRSMLQNTSGKEWAFTKDMEFLDHVGKDSVQMSSHGEHESKVNSLVDSPRSSATPEDVTEEVASVGASDEANETYFVPVTEMGADGGPTNGTESSRKRSYAGGMVAKKKKNDSLQEGLDMIRDITASLRERLSAASMDKYDRYGAFIASSLREMSEPAAKRKMAQLMDCMLNQGNRS